MDKQNSDRFLTAFNRIDKTLKEIADVRDFLPFYRLVNKAKLKNPIVRKYEDELRSFADLRNAIVHNSVSVEYVIAEPHIETVEMIEEIENKLTSPTLVGEMFHKRVKTFQTHDSLRHALNIIRTRKYTQFPVYRDREFQGLVTTTGITYWLAKSLQNKQMPKYMPTLQNVLQYEKGQVNYKFISRNLSVYETIEIFKEGVERGKRYEALLITEHGNPHERLLGIVTPHDVMKFE